MIESILEELRLDCTVCRIDRGFKEGVDHGIIVSCNSGVVCIKKYDRDGLFDGIKMVRIDDIEHLRFNGNGLNARGRFIANNGINLEPIKVSVGGFDEFMESANRQYGYVCVNDDRAGSCYIGPLISHDDNWIHMVNYGSPDRRDRSNVLVAKEEIQSLSVDEIYHRNLLSLYVDGETGDG